MTKFGIRNKRVSNISVTVVLELLTTSKYLIEHLSSLTFYQFLQLVNNGFWIHYAKRVESVAQLFSSTQK